MLSLLNITLLVAFLQASPSPEGQIRDYYSNIEAGRDVAASLWSLIHYAQENDDFMELVTDIGRETGQPWVSVWLDGDSDIYQAMHEISLIFEEPLIQLHLQLELEDSSRTSAYFADYMSQVPGTGLTARLLRDVAEGTALNEEYFAGNTWDFYHFLIFLNYRQIEFEEGFEPWDYIDRLLQRMDFYNQTSSDINRSYFNATVTRALYINSNDREIDANYDTLIDLAMLPETSFKRDLYWTFEDISYYFGKIDRSLYLQRSFTIPLTESLNDRVTLNIILSNHGAYLYKIGKFEEAKQVITTALQDTSNLYPNTQTLLFNNLSLTHYKLGDTNKYLETQFQALDFASTQENFSHQLNIYRNLHIYQRKNQNWNLAREYIDEARSIAESTNDRNELASVIISQAAFHHNFLDEDSLASDYLDEATQLLDDESSYRLKINLLFEKASIYRGVSDFEQSRESYQEAVQISLRNNDNITYLEAIVYLAEIELLLGNLTSTAQYILELNAHDISVINFRLLVKARTLEAKLAIEEGRFREAEESLALVTEQVLERAANTTDPEAGYWHIEDAYLDLFQVYTNHLISRGRHNDTLALLDRLKMINDASLYDNPLIRSAAMSEEELSRHQLLTEEIDRLRKNLLITTNSRDRFQLQNDISALSAQINQFSLRQSSNGPAGIRLWPIQARLNSNQAILHITRILDTLYLVTIEKNDITVKTRPLGDSEEQLFESAITGLSTGDTDLNDLYSVYNYLDIADLPAGIASLIVVPDSYLYQLPIDVLPVESPESATSYGAARYIIEEMEVSYLNNLDEFLTTSPKPYYAVDYAGFGISEFNNATNERPLVPLPGAPLEIRSIERKLNRFDVTESYTESEATPRRFLNQASRSRILHLATHSTISENDPLFSRLYLYPDANDSQTPDELSGQVFAYQLFNLNLENDLIMLNSCDSGSGRYFQGSGIMGISRALRYAGAHSLVLNSWVVNDQFASDFAVEFYSHINEGQTKTRSLREAKLHFLRTKSANPHYWGPYMLNGDTNAMVNKRGTTATYAFLLAFTLIGVWTTKRTLNKVA